MSTPVLGGRAPYRATKRVLDVTVAAVVLVATLPIVMVAVLGVKLSSPGPGFYKGLRAGRDGRPFRMWKVRTMHVNREVEGSITSPNDHRVIPFGALLRRFKVDELPQFINVLTGDMAIVGPRPEALDIVERHYTDWMRETLTVRPGVTGPGSVFGYLHGDSLLGNADTEADYANRLLPAKLALERAYLEQSSIANDFYYVGMTVLAVAAHVLGVTLSLPRHLTARAKEWAPQWNYESMS